MCACVCMCVCVTVCVYVIVCVCMPVYDTASVCCKLIIILCAVWKSSKANKEYDSRSTDVNIVHRSVLIPTTKL